MDEAETEPHFGKEDDETDWCCRGRINTAPYSQLGQDQQLPTLYCCEARFTGCENYIKTAPKLAWRAYLSPLHLLYQATPCILTLKTNRVSSWKRSSQFTSSR